MILANHARKREETSDKQSAGTLKKSVGAPLMCAIKSILPVRKAVCFGMTGRDLYFNHPGWMVDFEGEFVCVDGLQRITALQRFANNEIKAFGQYFCEFGGRLNLLNHYMTVHVNNLKTRKEVLRWYIEMNEGGTPHTKEEIARVRAMLERSPAPHKRNARGAER